MQRVTRWSALLGLFFLPLFVVGQTPTVATFAALNDEKVSAVAFTPNNQYLVVGTATGAVVRTTMTHLRDITRLYKVGDKPVQSLEVSNDGKYILSANGAGNVVLYEVQTGQTAEINVPVYPDQVVQISFSPDSRYFAVSSREGVSVFDTRSREQLAVKVLTQVSALRIRPDSKEILIGTKTKGDVILWDWQANTERVAFQNDFKVGGVTTADYSPSGQYIAVGFDRENKVHLLEAATLTDVAQLELRNGVQHVRFTRDGQFLVSADGKYKVKAWSLPDLALKISLREYESAVTSFAFTADGKHFIATDGSQPKLLDINWLQLEAWKPADVEPPAIALLSPRYDSGKELPDGSLYARANQRRTRVSFRVNDIGGVKLVEFNGQAVQPTQLGGNKYEIETPLVLEENKYIPMTIRAVDNAGNAVTQTYSVEYKAVELVGAENYYALLIAVEDYPDEKVPDLDQPAKDAQRLAGVLVDRYTFKRENVTILTNPTRAQMQQHFDDLQSQLTSNDNLLVFYAGHGVWDEQMQQGFWLPADADADARTNWFPNNTLKDYLGAIQTKHTLLIADACFSGGIFKTRAFGEDASPAIEEMYRLKSRKAMTSGALKTVPDKSVFLQYLISTLELNTDDYVTAADLFASFRTTVINNSPNRQVPLYGEIGSTGDQGGEFVFVRRKQ